MGVVASFVGGLAIGGVDFMLDATDLSEPIKKTITLVGGTGLGIGVSYLSGPVGCGMIGGSASSGGVGLIRHFVGTSPDEEDDDDEDEDKQIDNVSRRTRQRQKVTAQMSAVEMDVGMGSVSTMVGQDEVLVS